jgi:hypothetical protein
MNEQKTLVSAFYIRSPISFGLCVIKVDLSIDEKAKEPQADSLKAKFTLSLKNEKGEMQELSGVLFAVKGIRYRLDLSGPFWCGRCILFMGQRKMAHDLTYRKNLFRWPRVYDWGSFDSDVTSCEYSSIREIFFSVIYCPFLIKN